MSFLSTLKFTTIVDMRPSALERRRTRMIENLNDQLVRLNDPTYTLTHSKWVNGEQGKQLLQKVVPVRPWWREMPDGRIAFCVKTGLKKIEFKKGQSAILLESKDALPVLINGLIEAVRKGELDSLLTPPEEKRGVPQKKVA